MLVNFFAFLNYIFVTPSAKLLGIDKKPTQAGLVASTGHCEVNTANNSTSYYEGGLAPTNYYPVRMRKG